MSRRLIQKIHVVFRAAVSVRVPAVCLTELRKTYRMARTAQSDVGCTVRRQTRDTLWRSDVNRHQLAYILRTRRRQREEGGASIGWKIRGTIQYALQAESDWRCFRGCAISSSHMGARRQDFFPEGGQIQGCKKLTTFFLSCHLQNTGLRCN